MVKTVYGGASISLLLAIGARHVTARVPVPRAGRIWSVGDKVALAFDTERCRLYEP